MIRQCNASDPRWGSENRPAKAEVIWRTLSYFAGSAIQRDVWADIGCGSGGIAAALSPRVGRMIGIDPEPWQRWETWTKNNSNLNFIVGSYDSSPPFLNDASIDVAICNQVYEHVPDPQQLIAEIYRILKPGGYCYFAGPNLLFPIEPHVFWPFIHWIPRSLAIRIMKIAKAKSIIDANSTTYWKLKKWLREFEIIDAVPEIASAPSNFGKTGKAWGLVSVTPKWLTKSLMPLSPGFIFILRKPETKK